VFSSRGPSYFELRTTPTICHGPDAAGSPTVITCPIASPAGKKRSAIAWLTTATLSEVAVSPVPIVRPCNNGIPTVSKYPGVTRSRTVDESSSGPNFRPMISIGEVHDPIDMGGAEESDAFFTPGNAFTLCKTRSYNPLTCSVL